VQLHRRNPEISLPINRPNAELHLSLRPAVEADICLPQKIHIG
jgi:hypothetical protein